MSFEDVIGMVRMWLLNTMRCVGPDPMRFRFTCGTAAAGWKLMKNTATVFMVRGGPFEPTEFTAVRIVTKRFISRQWPADGKTAAGDCTEN
jgi:hypothetical protein